MRQPKDKGFAELAALLVGCAVLLILASVMIPSLVEAKRVSTEVAAAAELNQIATMEKTYSQYGAYVNPQFLTGTLPTPAVPLSCSNSFLMTGGQIEQPDGYTMNFVGTPTTFNCPGVAAGYSAYSITLVPTNPLFAQRSFFVDQTGVVRFNDDGTATASSPTYSITSSNGVVTVGSSGLGGNSPSSGSATVQFWNSSSVPQTGQEYLRPASLSGDTCGPTAAGQTWVGVFVSVTGVNDDPCQNVFGGGSDWLYSGVGVVTYTPAQIACNSPLSDFVSTFQVPGNGFDPTRGTNASPLVIPGNSVCGTYHTLTLSEAGGVPQIVIQSGGVLGLGIADDATNTYIDCSQGSGNGFSSCVGTGTLSINRGDKLNWIILQSGGGPQSYALTGLSWTLQ
jgi:hypothetical protein